MALKTFIWITGWDVGALASFLAFFLIIAYYNKKTLDDKVNKEDVKKDLINLKCELLKEVDLKIKKLRK